MPTRRLIPLFVALLACAAMMFAAPVGAQAQSVSVRASFAEPPPEPVAINVLVGQSRVINFDKPIGRFSVSNPDVAEAVLVAPDQVLVNGKAFGQVNFIAWEKGQGNFVVFDVFVRTNLSLIDAQIHALFPKDDIRLSQANGSVVLSGNVSNPLVAAQAEKVVKAAGFETVNMLGSPVKGTAQVQLQVRVAEVSRNRLRDYGTSFMTGKDGTATYTNSGGGPSSLSDFNTPTSLIESAISPALNVFFLNNPAGVAAMLRAVRQTGAIRSLAEPNLIAMDGQQASFLAGGEFPIPVVQSGSDRNTVTVVFKEYGVRLNFKPTILDEDHIRLELEPEVSTIDFSNGVKFDGFVIPALKTRRAKTGVELRDGQSFALAGLLDNNEIKTFSKIPVISEVPILGNLFKSKSFQRNETELMFIVTAQLVRPVSPDDIPQMRGLDGLKKGSPLGVEPKGEGVQGATGFSSGSTSANDADKKDADKKDANKAGATSGNSTSGASGEVKTDGAQVQSTSALPVSAATSVAQLAPVMSPARKQ